jgi:hypothetical protein
MSVEKAQQNGAVISSRRAIDFSPVPDSVASRFIET